MRKKRPAEHENHERWLVSYADFITLLFAFFVVMFASSQTDKAKANQVSEAIKDAIAQGGISAAVHEVLGGTVDEKGKGNAMMKGPGGTSTKPQVDSRPQSDLAMAELMPSLTYLTQELKDEIANGKVQIKLTPRGLVVTLLQAAFFPSGADGIAPETYPSIQKIAGVIRNLPNPVRLEGHTDSMPIHTARFRDNWDLSAARAIAMLQLLSTRFGIARERLALAGYAETMPAGPNDTEQGRARNRRVDVVILNQRMRMSEPDLAAAVRSAPAAPAAPAPAPAASSAKPLDAKSARP
jgi:chemotaxis protein MotB